MNHPIYSLDYLVNRLEIAEDGVYLSSHCIYYFEVEKLIRTIIASNHKDHK
jgi:hypothetical protein